MDREAELIRSGILRQKDCMKPEFAALKQEFVRHKRRGRERNSNHPDNPDRRKHREVHQKRIENVKYVVDDNDPMELENMYEEQEKYNRHLREYTKLELENAALMMRIKNIELTTRKIRNPPPYMQQPDHFRQKQLFQQTYDNCIIHRRLQNVKALISREAQHKWHQNQQRYFLRRCKYPPYWMARPCSPSTKDAYKKSLTNSRPIVYLDLEVLNKVCGRVLFELAADICPLTAENFRSLCAGSQGKSYRGYHMDRFLPNLFWRGGGAGSSGGPELPIENYDIAHDKEGVLSMVCYGSKVHTTEFMISAKALPCMDKVNVAFGWVLDGLDFLIELEEFCKPFETGKPRYPVKIIDCGETNLDEVNNLKQPVLSKFMVKEKEELLYEELLKGPRKTSTSTRRSISADRSRHSGRTVKYAMDEDEKQTLENIMADTRRSLGYQ